MITVYARSAESPFPAGPALCIVRTAACVADESETLYIKRTEQIANSVQKTIVSIVANCTQSSRVCKNIVLTVRLCALQRLTGSKV